MMKFSFVPPFTKATIQAGKEQKFIYKYTPKKTGDSKDTLPSKAMQCLMPNTK